MIPTAGSRTTTQRGWRAGQRRHPGGIAPLDGADCGRADAVRAVIGGARQLYDRQDFSFAGPWGENSFIEDYTAEVRGAPVGAVHLITFNADGKAAAHPSSATWPLSSLMFFSRLLREKFARTPYAEHYLAGEV